MSAHDFIRTLKAPSDPPQSGGPCKIEIATEAWKNNAFYVPGKCEVITDWVLTRLLKDRTKERAVNPIFDKRYWQLLLDILSPLNPAKGGSGTNTRFANAWLVTLLGRIPIAPITISLFGTFGENVDEDPVESVAEVACRCLALLWPAAVAKIPAESLLDCFSSVLASRIALAEKASLDSTEDPTLRAQLLVVSSYRSALANSSNKKKLYGLFIDRVFQTWIQCIHLPTGKNVSSLALSSEIDSAGVETLFNVDVLRQAGEQKYDAAFKTALATILTTDQIPGPASLPRLFEAFLQAIKRHKSAVFSQGSNPVTGALAEQVQMTGMEFYALCDSLLVSSGRKEEVWRARIALLNIVHSESLYSSRREDDTVTMSRNCALAVQTIESAREEEHKSSIDYAIQLLLVLMRIDHDLVAPSLPKILPRLALLPECLESTLALLSSDMEYATKSRTVNAYVLRSLQSFSTQRLQKISSQKNRELYQRAFSGPFLDFTYLDKLSKCIQTSLTPGQIVDTVQSVLQELKAAFDEFKERAATAAANNGDGPRKKRKKDSFTDSASRVEPEAAAVSFALVTRTVAVVLASLPIHLLLDDAQEGIRTTISEAHSALIVDVLKGRFDAVEKHHRMDTWASQLVASSTLRFRYDLVAARQLLLRLDAIDAFICIILADCLSEDTIPELSIEMFRILLSQKFAQKADAQPVFDGVLIYLERNVRNNDDKWSGRAHHLSDVSAHGQGTVALLHLIMHRWLPLFDELASEQQLSRLAKLVITIGAETTGDAGKVLQKVLSPQMTVLQVLHDAATWELHAFREAFIAQINEQTASFRDLNLPDLLSDPKIAKKKEAHIRNVSAVFGLILHAPAEYLPRASRIELVRRALAADAICVTMMRHDHGAQRMSSRSVLLVREFLRRTFGHFGTVEHSLTQDYLEFIIGPVTGFSVKDVAMEAKILAVTLDLVGLIFGSFLKSSQQGDEDAMLGSVQFLIKRLTSMPCTDRWSISVTQRSMWKLIDLVTSTFKLYHFPERLVSAFRDLYAHAMTQYNPLVETLATGLGDLATTSDTDVLDTWAHLLRFGRWMQSDASHTPLFARRLLAQILKPSGTKQLSGDVRMSAFSILLEELQSCTGDHRREYLGYTMAAYVRFNQFCDIVGAKTLGDRLASVLKTLRVVDFAYVADIVAEALSHAESEYPSDLISLLRLSSLMVHDAPEGTSKITRTHTTRCLNLFVNFPAFVEDAAVRREVLGFLSQLLNDRPAAIRTGDMTSLWALLDDILAGSRSHDPETDATVYHDVVSTLSALVRLRRDLVLCALPHFSALLQRLILSLRAPRPHLGGKQSKIVMDSLPQWISPNKPLSSEESKSLARLMTTLQTKTMIRAHGAADTQKPESLARPFAKHAAYVIKAYIEAVTDPLCQVSQSVRKELQPGLFALCDMLGEYSRDALMVSALDAGGKTVMKTLWKEYEKQKYIGKG